MPVNPSDDALTPPDATHEGNRAGGIVSVRPGMPEPELNEGAVDGVVEVEYRGVEGDSRRMLDPSLDMELDYVRYSVAKEALNLVHLYGGIFAEMEKNKVTVSVRDGSNEQLSAYSTRALNMIGNQIIDVLYDATMADKNGDKIIRPEEGAAIANQLESLMRDIYGDDSGKQGSTSENFVKVIEYFRNPESYESPGGQPGALGGIHSERMRGQLSSYLEGVDSSDRASIYKDGKGRYADNPTVMIPKGKSLLEKLPFIANQVSSDATSIASPVARVETTGKTYLFAGNRLDVPVTGVNVPDGYILEENVGKLMEFFEQYLTGKPVLLEPTRAPVYSPPIEQGIDVAALPEGPSSTPNVATANPRSTGPATRT